MPCVSFTKTSSLLVPLRFQLHAGLKDDYIGPVGYKETKPLRI